MLTARQIELIKATVPVLKEHGVALTTHFYKRMLNGNPELKNVFNQAHQAQGQQQKALAGAVLAYAENIENPMVLLGAVKHIAIKHATINIRPEQYDIVGRHLLASIKEVLGDAATDELIDAWAAAYQQLATILIGVEADIYKDHVNTEGGWAGWRPFAVVARKAETDDVVSFTLKPVDGGKVAKALPGQFLSVQNYLEDRKMLQPRQYTITEATDESYRITVKRLDSAKHTVPGAMSTHLHNNIEIGDILQVSAPTGEFVIQDNDKPVIFLSAGIGITPILPMLRHVADTTPNRSVTFLYTTTDHDHFPLKTEVKPTLGRLTNKRCAVFLTNDTHQCSCGCGRLGRIDKEVLAGLNLDKTADVYICGPVKFMQDMRAALTEEGFAAEQIHSEVFGTGTMA